MSPSPSLARRTRGNTTHPSWRLPSSTSRLSLPRTRPPPQTPSIHSRVEEQQRQHARMEKERAPLSLGIIYEKPNVSLSIRPISIRIGPENYIAPNPSLLKSFSLSPPRGTIDISRSLPLLYVRQSMPRITRPVLRRGALDKERRPPLSLVFMDIFVGAYRSFAVHARLLCVWVVWRPRRAR